MLPSSTRSILWKWEPTIFPKWQTPLDSLVNQDLEYAMDGQACKLEDNCIWKPPILFLPFASVLLGLEECSSSEFSLCLLLCSWRLRAFDGSWLPLMPPTWDLSHILQVQNRDRKREVYSPENSGRWQNSNPSWPFPFLQITWFIIQNIADDVETINPLSKQHSWFPASKWKEITAAPQGFN